MRSPRSLALVAAAACDAAVYRAPSAEQAPGGGKPAPPQDDGRGQASGGGRESEAERGPGPAPDASRAAGDAATAAARADAGRTGAGRAADAGGRRDAAAHEPPGSTLRLVAFGDHGVGRDDPRELAEAIAEHCAARGCDLVLGLGDNFYNGGIDEPCDDKLDDRFERQFAALDLPFYMSLGDHDHDGVIQYQIDYTDNLGDCPFWTGKWHMPDRTFRLREGPAELVALDTTEFDDGGGGAQQDRAIDALESSDAPFKVVFGHAPLRSNGEEYGDADGTLGARLEAILCRPDGSRRADLYLAGHDHHLEHLVGSPCDLELVISGGGGAHPRGIAPGPDTLYGRQANGFAWIELRPGGLTIELVEVEIDSVPLIWQVAYHYEAAR